MARAVHLETKPEPGSAGVSAGTRVTECAVIMAAALEMLLLVGGMLWAVNSPRGASLWPRILVVSALAVGGAVLMLCACFPRSRSLSAENGESNPSEVDSRE